MPRFRLIKKKECWVLTWPARFLVLFVFFLAVMVFMRYIPVFLSINKPVESKVLVIDGQMSDYAILKAIRIFDSCHYELIITTGGIIQSGYQLSGNKTMAGYSRDMITGYGLKSEKIIALEGGNVIRNRTYASAQMLQNWIRESKYPYNAFNIFSVGTHARRSRLLFRKALGKEYQVGTVTIENPAYEPRTWWRSSIGARSVISETIAYIYVRFFFAE